MLWNRFAQLLVARIDSEAPQARDAMLTSSIESLLHGPADGEAARIGQTIQRELARRLGEERAHALYEGALLDAEAEEDGFLEEELGKRLRLGVPGFDRLVDGLPACASVLVLGAPGSGKSTLVKQYVAEGLREGQSGLMVSTGEDRGMFEREMLRITGLDVHELIVSGRLAFIDAYSWTRGKQAGKHDGVYTCPTPSLDDVSMAVHYAVEGMPRKKVKRMGFDSLSTLFLHNPLENVLRFTELLRGRMGNDCFTSLLTVEDGMHPPEALRALGAVSDGTIQLGLDGGSYYVSVPRLRGSPANGHRLRLELTPRGLAVQEVWDALARPDGKR